MHVKIKLFRNFIIVFTCFNLFCYNFNLGVKKVNADELTPILTATEYLASIGIGSSVLSNLAVPLLAITPVFTAKVQSDSSDSKGTYLQYLFKDYCQTIGVSSVANDFISDFYMDDGIINSFISDNGLSSIIDFLLSKEGTDYTVDLKLTGITGSKSISVPSPNTLSGTFSTYSIVCSFNSTGDSTFLGLSFSPGSYYVYTGSIFPGYSMSGCNQYYISTSSSVSIIANAYNPYLDIISSPGDIIRSSPEYVKTGTTSNFVFSTTGLASINVSQSDFLTYPDSLGVYDSLQQYEKSNVYTGSPSVCVDWDKLLKGQDLSNVKNVDDLVGVLEGVISSPTGADVIGGSVSLEYDGVQVEPKPDVTYDDDTRGIIQKIIDWIMELFKDLADLLANLLSKLLEGLKKLLLSLFVPADSFISDQVSILKSNLEPKLPYTQFISLFNFNYDGSSLKDIYINWNGKDIVIVKVTLFEKFRSLFNWGVYAVTFFLLSVYNYNNIYKLIRGTDYVSASNTINNSRSNKEGD